MRYAILGLLIRWIGWFQRGLDSVVLWLVGVHLDGYMKRRCFECGMCVGPCAYDDLLNPVHGDAKNADKSSSPAEGKGEVK